MSEKPVPLNFRLHRIQRCDCSLSPQFCKLPGAAVRSVAHALSCWLRLQEFLLLAKPFLEWLKTADEEEDEDDETSSGASEDTCDEDAAAPRC